ncbi:MAG: SdiA-regulated domain-containing protein [Sporocytophaga sp.]|uniref:SdiA-regulated domain-containing protein n=1 Tax=Sporocytophaga sp. TaxID=2231183 RepID=UPI001B165843|nr:SdiA-regulated domain-containing protein [Sporocytophaga sp.]MBO9699965.1 SdiA-regulated domain-containing protein [Sporocytophaga sp.]
MKVILNALFIVILISGCNSKNIKTDIREDSDKTSSGIEKTSTNLPYDLNKPTATYTLPEILNEVSGLTFIDSAHVACIQDELGSAFIYNLNNNSIVYEHKFDQDGDFEGVTYTRKSLYILRSDGRLTEWGNFNVQTGGKEIQHTSPSIETANNEGLCFDSLQNRLLIAGKSKPANNKSERFIYEYSLTKKEFKSKPAFRININELEKVALSFNIEQKEYTKKGKLKPFNFRPSDLAVHPITSDIYILSAADNLLIVIDRNGNIKYISKLNSDLFPKAEGIAFSPNGTMLISNEASGNVPTILTFKFCPIKN